MPINIFSTKPPSEEEIVADPSVVAKYLIELKEVINTLDKHYLSINGFNIVNKGVTFKDTPLLDPLKPGTIEYHDGHWYLANGVRKVITTSAGVKTEDTIVVNTIDPTVIFNYTFAPHELHHDEKFILNLSGFIKAAAASDGYTIEFNYNGITRHTLVRPNGNVSDVGWQALYEATIREDGTEGNFIDYASYFELTRVIQVGEVIESAGHDIDTTEEILFEVVVTWNAAKADNSITCAQGHLVFHH